MIVPAKSNARCDYKIQTYAAVFRGAPLSNTLIGTFQDALDKTYRAHSFVENLLICTQCIIESTQ